MFLGIMSASRFKRYGRMYAALRWGWIISSRMVLRTLLQTLPWGIGPECIAIRARCR